MFLHNTDRGSYMQINEFEDEDASAWEHYVKKNSDSTFYHQIGWKKVIEKTYGHEPLYLIAKEYNEISGVFPLFLIKNKIFGKKIISIPFAPYGGICADSLSTKNALVKEAKRIVDNYNADFLEIRGSSGDDNELLTNSSYYTLVLDLDENPDLVWNQLSRKVRNATRKAVNSDLTFEMDNKYERDFYSIFSRNIRDLGAPVHSSKFFENLLSEFPENTDVAVAKYEDKVIGSIFLLYFKDTVISGWAASDKSYRMYNPNNIMYWESIKYGCEKGFKYFDFGRSLMDSGTYRFKKPWGAEPKQLHYHYYLNHTSKMPDTSQSNSKRKTFSKLWEKLPVPIANFIGPKLRKNFP